jgi:hypothetical protein
MTSARSICIAVGCLLALACQEQRDDVNNAVEAAKGMAELAQSLKKAGEQAEAAGKIAEKQGAADLAAGKDPALVKDQTEMAKGLAAMQALAAGGGASVNWRQLQPFLPDELGGFAASSELKGETQKMGNFQTSQVSRSYKEGDVRASVKISDSSAMPLLRAPFAMAAMVEEDSTSGFKKGKKIDGHTAIVEWKEKSKQSEVTVLVADRFVVDIDVSKAASPEAAEALLKQLDLAKLTALKPEEPAK